MTYHSGNQLIDPYLLFQKAQLRAGMHAADLGCGRTGHVVFPASVIIGEQGILYAVDVLKDALQAVRKRAQMENLMNVETVWSDLEQVGKTAIPPRSLDAAFIVNVLAKVKNRHALLEETKRLLKDKARCVVVDWKNAILPLGPKAEHLVDFKEIKAWAQKNGFVVQEEFLVGNYHAGVVLFRHENIKA